MGAAKLRVVEIFTRRWRDSPRSPNYFRVVLVPNRTFREVARGTAHASQLAGRAGFAPNRSRPLALSGEGRLLRAFQSWGERGHSLPAMGGLVGFTQAERAEQLAPNSLRGGRRLQGQRRIGGRRSLLALCCRPRVGHGLGDGFRRPARIATTVRLLTSTGNQTGAFHGRGMRNSTSGVVGDAGQRIVHQSQK